MTNHTEKIRLEDAMLQDMEGDIRFWEIEGLQIAKEHIPEEFKDATVQKTFVMSMAGRCYHVGLQLLQTREIFQGVQGNPEEWMCSVAGFTKLEEMKKEFPKLFELEGFLYTVSRK